MLVQRGVKKEDLKLYTFETMNIQVLMHKHSCVFCKFIKDIYFDSTGPWFFSCSRRRVCKCDGTCKYFVKAKHDDHKWINEGDNNDRQT